jgi:hypothetical protein
VNTNIKPGQPVWTIFTGFVIRNIIKDVSNGSGREYTPEDGDRCFIRWNRRHSWIKHDEAFYTERDAKLALAAKLRARAASCLREAEELEAVSK